MTPEPEVHSSPETSLPSHSSGTRDCRPFHLPNTGDQDLSLPIAMRRAPRERRLPMRFADDMPQPLCALPPHPKDLSKEIRTTPSDRNALHKSAQELSNGATTTSQPGTHILFSEKNRFHVFRRYNAVDFPSHDPDVGLPATYFSDIAKDLSSYAPFPNKSSFRLGEWFWKEGSQKSVEDFNNLIQILLDPEFSLEDVGNTQWKQVHNQLGCLEENDAPWLNGENNIGWVHEPITLQIPFKKTKGSANSVKEYPAGNFYRRSIANVLRERLTSVDAQHLHYDPYWMYWQPHPEDDPMQVFGELYTSPEFLRVHEELQNSPPEPGCTLPRVVVGLIFSSDVTQLTQFGDRKLWPVYMFLGNDSKYRRNQRSSFLCNQIAYLESVSRALFLWFHGLDEVSASR